MNLYSKLTDTYDASERGKHFSLSVHNLLKIVFRLVAAISCMHEAQTFTAVSEVSKVDEQSAAGHGSLTNVLH